MTQLGPAIDALVTAVTPAFSAAQAEFWTACRKQDPGTRDQVAPGPFRTEVEAALLYLDQNSQAAPLLGDLLLARPADAPLRDAVGRAFPPALAAVPDVRFRLESLIASALSSDQAATLRQTLGRIDALTAAVTAYKAMHDALHLLQPCLSLMRGVAANQSRWGDFRVYGDIFRQQLATIDAAATRLAAGGVTRSLDFREVIDHTMATLTAAVAAAQPYDVADAMSQLSSDVEDGLNSVDVSMRDTAQDAVQPFTVALAFFTPLAQSAAGSSFEPLITSFNDFARRVSGEMQVAITEHSRWQRLDRQFNLLQRTVVENLPDVPGQIDAVWRLTSRGLSELCGAQPVPDWAAAIAELMVRATADLAPPVSPPVAEEVRDRVSNLISSGRSRFMAVDQSLLNWLEASLTNRPQLLALLQSPEMAGHA